MMIRGFSVMKDATACVSAKMKKRAHGSGYSFCGESLYENAAIYQ